MPENAPRHQPSLCRFGQQSCGACCWGAAVQRPELTRRLHRNRDSFRKVVASGKLSGLRLLWHETKVHRGVNLIWAIGLRIPGLREHIKRRLAIRLVCPFVAFDSEDGQHVGCLLHPTRWAGQDIRSQTAFRGLPGIECGDPDYICSGCHRYDNMTDRQQVAFHSAVCQMDWFDYTNAVRAFSCVPHRGVSSAQAASPGRDGAAEPERLLPIIEENAA